MKRITVLLAAAVLFCSVGFAQIPHSIHHQGFLTNPSGTPVTGTRAMIFRLYTVPTGGTSVWSQAFPSVNVSSGVFNAVLNVTPVEFTAQYYIETEVEGFVLTPRRPLASVPYALGPWSAIGSDLSYTSGNVGIGTTSPTAKLHIGGTSGVDGIRFPDGTLQTTAAAGGGGGGWTDDGTTVRLSTSTDNIGIGTASPSAKLHISNGALRITGGDDAQPNEIWANSSANLAYSAYGGHTFVVDADNNPGGDYFDVRHVSTVGPVYFRVTLDGNVGIGTTSPAGKFHVNNDVSGSDSSFVVANSGKVGIGTTTPTAKLEIGGTAGVDGIKFPDGTLQTTAAGGSSSGSPWISSSSPEGIYYAPYPSSAHVGIGWYPSSAARLSVDGGIVAHSHGMGTLDVSCIGMSFDDVTTHMGYLVTKNTPGFDGVGMAFKIGDGTIEAMRMITGAGGGGIPSRIGISTTEPSNVLTVALNSSSTTFIGTDATVGIINTDLTSNNWSTLSFQGKGTGGSSQRAARIGAQITARGSASITGDLVMSTVDAGAESERMRITSIGNVGIGTVSPGASNLLELSSTTKGLVLPRMTKSQRDGIASPVAGMMIYQTDNTPGLRVYNGTNWMRFTETID